MKVLLKAVPALILTSNSITLVTDDEAGIHKAVTKLLPGIKHVRCWNHVFNAMKIWLKKHGATPNEIPSYISDTRHLLHRNSLSNYQSALDEFKKKWSKPFLEYFMSNVHPEVPKSLGRFVLEPLHVYHPSSGVTNNMSESFNATLKRLQRWKEVPVDSIVLTLYNLQCYHFNEIQRGFAGLGNYELLPSLSNLKCSVDEMKLIKCVSPDVMVEMIHDGSSNNENQCASQKSSPISENSYTQSSEVLQLSSQGARAKFILENKNISHNQELGVFTVLGVGGNPHAVRLFPTESCSCPSTAKCCHIIAVKMSVGLMDPDGKMKVNLTQLRRNTRVRKTGRKVPKVDDYNVIAAPDSIDAQNDIQLNTNYEATQDNSSIAIEQSIVTNAQSCQADKSEKENEENIINKSQLVNDKQTQSNIANFTENNTLSASAGRKRKRCGTCENCTMKDCGLCKFCLDKPKFGGKGTLKQACSNRACKKFKLEEKITDSQPIKKSVQTPDKVKVDLTFEDSVETVSDSTDNNGKCLVTCERALVKLQDFRTIYLGEYLNDLIIDYAAQYFVSIMDSLNPANNHDYNYCILPTAVFSKLMSSQADNLMDCYFLDYTATNDEAIIMPCCFHDHWILVVIYPHLKIISSYDSIGGYIHRIRKPLQLLGKYLETSFPLNKDHFDITKYSYIEEIVQKQENNIDCGVFMCRFLYNILLNEGDTQFETDSKSIRQWLILLLLQSFKYGKYAVNVNQEILQKAEEEITRAGYSISPSNDDRTLCSHNKDLDTLMMQETIENIKNSNMLVPSFNNNNDMPEDMSDLPFGYDTYISGFPLLQRLESNLTEIFDRNFIRQNVKSLEEYIRELYKNPEASQFFQEQEFTKKIDVGRTNFWPLEQEDMELELIYYLMGLESDLENRCVPVLSFKMKRIVIPEILTKLIQKRFGVTESEALKIYKAKKF